MRAADLIAQLGLEPHPEGGHYREIFRDAQVGLQRGALTLIDYLLAEGEQSRWHRLDAVEVWHYAGGAPLALRLWAPGGVLLEHRLGGALEAGETPRVVVPVGTWQSAVSRGEWTLVSCAVAPAFEFAGLELAPEGWEPPVDGGGPVPPSGDS
jgi:predicted cupin superfamily sugar epimerase